ncbi:MAG: hypothetical protein ACXWZB_01780 [Gaiellaceae bacterium]
MLVLVLALPAWGAPPRRATLKLVAQAPLVVRGHGFGPGERGVLVAIGPARSQAKVARATRNGSFLAAFPRIRLRRCDELTVRATGAAGSRATLQRHPDCKERKKEDD